jgi:hypothetical protein
MIFTIVTMYHDIATSRSEINVFSLGEISLLVFNLQTLNDIYNCGNVPWYCDITQRNKCCSFVG